MKKFTIIFLVLITLLFSIPILNAQDAQEPKRIAVVGSSLATGWISTHKFPYDMRAGWAQRLGRNLMEKNYAVVNLGIPGDTTKHVLARLHEDVIMLRPEYAIISLSLENEGFRKEDPEKIFRQFSANLRKIVDTCRENGIEPVVGFCYANNQNEPKHVEYIEKMNLVINSWDVSSINFYGALENGKGQYPEGYNADGDHPNTLGHAEFSYAIVPTLFDAIGQGKPIPVRQKNDGFFAFDSVGLHDLSFISEKAVHSFTLSFSARMHGDGDLLSIISSDKTIKIAYKKGYFVLNTGKDDEIKSKAAVKEDQWVRLYYVQRYAAKETILYIDDKPVITLSDVVEPREFVIAPGEKPAEFDIKDLMLHRAALDNKEIELINNGGLVKASLEVYSPLNDKIEPGKTVSNLARSLSGFVPMRIDREERIAALEKEYAKIEAEKEFLESLRRQAFKVDEKALESYLGEYKVDENFSVKIIIKDGKLHVDDPRGQQIELKPVKEHWFKMNIPGVEIELEFVKNDKGEFDKLILHDSQGTLKAKRLIN